MDITDYSREDAQAAVQRAKDQPGAQGRKLIPWLPDPHTCDCGALCEADTQYVAEQAYHVDVWDCPECDKRYYRDEKELF